MKGLVNLEVVREEEEGIVVSIVVDLTYVHPLSRLLLKNLRADEEMFS